MIVSIGKGIFLTMQRFDKIVSIGIGISLTMQRFDKIVSIGKGISLTMQSFDKIHCVRLCFPLQQVQTHKQNQPQLKTFCLFEMYCTSTGRRDTSQGVRVEIILTWSGSNPGAGRAWCPTASQVNTLRDREGGEGEDREAGRDKGQEGEVAERVRKREVKKGWGTHWDAA